MFMIARFCSCGPVLAVALGSVLGIPCLISLLFSFCLRARYWLDARYTLDVDAS